MLIARENPSRHAAALLDLLMQDVWLGHLTVQFARLLDGSGEGVDGIVYDENDAPTRKRYLVPKGPAELLAMFAKAADFPWDNPLMEEISGISVERQAAVLSTWATAKYDPKRIFLRRLHVSAQDALAWCDRRRMARPRTWHQTFKSDTIPARKGAPPRWNWPLLVEAVAKQLASTPEDWSKKAIIAALQDAAQKSKGWKPSRSTAQKYTEKTLARAAKLRLADLDEENLAT